MFMIYVRYKKNLGVNNYFEAFCIIEMFLLTLQFGKRK